MAIDMGTIYHAASKTTVIPDIFEFSLAFHIFYAIFILKYYVHKEIIL
jgi:hypothetical protein